MRMRKANAARRRGAVSVLAMILLILFGSLVAAMAIASKGNIRTAATHIHVVKAMGAAETGLAVAESRLSEAAGRFIVAHSDIDGTFGWDLWRGNLTGYGSVNVIAPPSGYSETNSPAGLGQALLNNHAADTNIDASQGVDEPQFVAAPVSVDPLEYKLTDWLVTPAIPVADASGTARELFQITYAPLANGTDIRVIVTGIDTGYSSTTRDAAETPRPITRTVMKDYRFVKRVDHAIISPSKVMIGKNVMIEGNLGATYQDVTQVNGDPMILHSDFYGMDATLDAKYDDFFAALLSSDVDGDNRLRTAHPVEGASGLTPADYDGDGSADTGTFSDVTGDGYVDEFDIFINHYDSNGDGRVNIATELVDSSGNPVDPDLALLIDMSTPDRNRNGVWGFDDQNRNGLKDAGEGFLDIDPVHGVAADNELGYLDGYIDRLDAYAKVRGHLSFKTSQGDWAAANPNYQDLLRGPISPGEDEYAMEFGASADSLPVFDSSTFAGAETDLKSAVNGDAFTKQVADQLGVSEAALVSYIETTSPGTVGAGGKLVPRYLRLDPDTDGDGLPDNSTESYVHFEKMPFNSPNFADWYYRPVYENFEFKDVEIPAGTNALFVNCTFAGITWVRSYTNNTHPHWTNFGKMEIKSGETKPTPVYARTVYGDDPGEDSSEVYAGATAAFDPGNGQYLLRAVSPLDKGDILNSEIPTYDPADYAQLPEPLMITLSGTTYRVTDTREWSNNIRFHDCMFVGSIVSDAPQQYTHVRNKLQFTGSTQFVDEYPDDPTNPLLNPDEDDIDVIAKSSMLLPNYSVDIGQFNSPTSQNVELKGAVIAGVLDVRGNTTIDGALLLTFAPTAGQGPLVDHLGNPIGNPALFNASIGYFGPAQGDEESLDPATLPLVSGQRIVGWDTDGDGIADVSPFDAQPAGSVAVPFNGYGRVQIRFNPNMSLPNGIQLPMQIDPIGMSYAEGKF